MAVTETLSGPAGPAYPDRALAPSTLPPMSRVERARLILAGTTAFVSAVMVAWMILAPLFAPAKRKPSLIAATLGAPDSLADVGAVLSNDARLIAGGDRGPGRLVSGRRELASAIMEVGKRGGTDPLVVYVAAAGVSGPADQGVRAYFLSPESRPGQKKTLIPTDELIALFQQRKGVPKLLLLDLGPIDSDRGLNVFGNSLAAQLEPLIERNGDLVVLASNAPGQVSWVSEPDGRSVFAHFIAAGLSGSAGSWGKVTVQGLHRYVQTAVADWVDRNREHARQTPVLLGNTKLDFVLPKLNVPVIPEPTDEKRATALKALQDAWTEHAALRAQGPSRHAALAWAHYTEAILKAERLLRVNDLDGAEAALGAAKTLQGRVSSELAGPQPARPHSLAMLAARDTNQGSPADAPSRESAYRRTIDRAFLGLASPPPPAEPAKPAAPEATKKPAQPKAETKKGAAPKKEAPAAKKKDEPPQAKKKDEPKKAPAEPKKAPAEPNGNGEENTDATADENNDQDEPRAEKDDEPKDAAKPPAAPEAPEDIPLERESGMPTYVEGQLPVWYSAYVNRLGPTDPQASARIVGLRRATDLRFKAEQAASDPRATLWVRDLVDQGDDLRRQGQDLLFANEPAAIKEAGPLLAQAEALYDQALTLSRQVGRATELVQTLQDELPYFGAWQVRQPDGPDETIWTLLKDSTELANTLQSGPAAKSSAEDRRKGLAPVIERVVQGRQKLESALADAVDRGSARSASAGWRLIDALLRVPFIAVDARMTLLERLHSGEGVSGASPEPLNNETPDTKPDPGFWQVARDTARLEAALLTLGGLDARALSDSPVIASGLSSREKNLAVAFDQFDRFADGVRELRQRVATLDRPAARAETAETKGAEAAERASEQNLGQLVAAARAARALPPIEMKALTTDPASLLDDFRLHELLVWHADRLCDDFAPEHATRLLEDARRLATSKALWDGFDRAHALAAASVSLKRPSAGARRDFTLTIASEGSLPAGKAALLVNHDPAVPLTADFGDATSLVPLPTEGEKPAKRSVTLTTTAALNEGSKLLPEAFYRGHTFSAGTVTLPASANVVSVELRQQKRYKNFPDQFAINRGKGFLHPQQALDYKLVVKNLSGRPIQAHVSYALEGEPADEGDIKLEPFGTNETLTGSVRGPRLPDDQPKMMTITVTEETPDGPPLFKPMNVPFTKVHPKEFIKGSAGLDGDLFFVWVSHDARTDPVPVPSNILVTVEPANALRAVNNNRAYVGHGNLRKFEFQILKPIKAIKWTVMADDVKDVDGGNFVLESE